MKLLAIGFMFLAFRPFLAAAPLDDLSVALRTGKLRDELYPILRACAEEGHALEAWQQMRAEFESQQDGPLRLQRVRVTRWIAWVAGRENEIMELSNTRMNQKATAEAQLEHALYESAAGRSDRTLEDVQAAARQDINARFVEAFLHEVTTTPYHAQHGEPAMMLLEQRMLGKTTTVDRLELARWHLLDGSHERARLLAMQAFSAKDADNAAILKLLITAAHLRDWDIVQDLGKPVSGRFEKDISFKTIRAVALEEMGHAAEAIDAFLDLIEARTLCPNNECTVQSADAYRQLPLGLLAQQGPPGLDFLRDLVAWRFHAYAHRQPPTSSGGKAWATEWFALRFPVSQQDVTAFALHHLGRLRELIPDADQHALDKRIALTGLPAAGWESACAWARGSGAPSFDPVTASETMLASWLIEDGRDYTSATAAATLQHCVQVFQHRYPTLELLAVVRSQRGSPSDSAHTAAAWEIFRGQIAPGGKIAQRTALTIVQNYGGQMRERAEWKQLELELKEADPQMSENKSAPRDFTPDEVAIARLVELRQPEMARERAQIVEAEALRLAPNAWKAMKGSRNSGRVPGDAALNFPNYLVRWPRSVRWALQVDDLTSNTQSEDSMIPFLKDPRLVLIARWCLRFDPTVLEELEAIASSPTGTPTDWALAAWVAWDTRSKFPEQEAEQKATFRAAQCLARATAGKVPDDASYFLDVALISAVLALTDKPPGLIDAARHAANRMLAGRWLGSQDEWERAFTRLGLTEQAAKVKGRPTPVLPHMVDRMVEPVNSTFASSRGYLDDDMARGIVNFENRILISLVPFAKLDLYRSHDRPKLTPAMQRQAVDEALRVARKLSCQDVTGDLMSQHTVDIRGKHWIAAQLDQWQLRETAVRSAVPADTAPARQWLDAASTLLELQAFTEANKCALRAMELNPRFTALAKEKIATASAHDIDVALVALDELDDNALGRRLAEFAVRSDWTTGRDAPPTAEERIAITWLKQAAVSRKALPSAAVYGFQSLLSDHKPRDEDFCRAATEFSALRDNAFARLADDATRDGQPLEPIAALLKQTLGQVPIETAFDPLTSGSVSYTSKFDPEFSRIIRPGPVLILIQDAWERGAAAEVNAIILPLLESRQKAAARLFADMFFCAEADFPNAAEAYAGDEQAQYQLLRGLDAAVWVWQKRKLAVSLEKLLLRKIVTEQPWNFDPSAMAHYVACAEHLSQAETRALIERLRTLWVGGELQTAQDQARLGGRQKQAPDSPDHWRRALDASGMTRYHQFLERLFVEPRVCRLAMEMALETGYATDPNGYPQSVAGPFKYELMVERSIPRLLDLADQYALTADAAHWRSWGQVGSAPGMASVFAGLLNNEDPTLQQLKKTLEERQPRTFGVALLLLEAQYARANDSKERKSLLLAFIDQHRDDLARIPAERWQDLSTGYVGTAEWKRWWTIEDPKEQEILQPFIAAERRYVQWLGERILAVQKWRDLGMHGGAFMEASGRTFVHLAETDPKQAKVVAHKVADLLVALRTEPNAPKDSNIGDDPVSRWIYEATPTLKSATLMLEIVDQLPGLSSEALDKAHTRLPHQIRNFERDQEEARHKESRR